MLPVHRLQIGLQHYQPRASLRNPQEKEHLVSRGGGLPTEHARGSVLQMRWQAFLSEEWSPSGIPNQSCTVQRLYGRRHGTGDHQMY